MAQCFDTENTDQCRPWIIPLGTRSCASRLDGAAQTPVRSPVGGFRPMESADVSHLDLERSVGASNNITQANDISPLVPATPWNTQPPTVRLQWEMDVAKVRRCILLRASCEYGGGTLFRQKQAGEGGVVAWVCRGGGNLPAAPSLGP